MYEYGKSTNTRGNLYHLYTPVVRDGAVDVKVGNIEIRHPKDPVTVCKGDSPPPWRAFAVE